MHRQLFHPSPLMLLPLAALLIFLLVFVAIVLRTWRSGPADVARASRLPLGEDDHG